VLDLRAAALSRALGVLSTTCSQALGAAARPRCAVRAQAISRPWVLTLTLRGAQKAPHGVVSLLSA